MAEIKTLMNAEQAWALAGTRRFELVRGEVIEMPAVGGEHGWIVIEFAARLLSFIKEKRLGRVGTEWGFILAQDPDTVRAPDIAFVTAERLTPSTAKRFFPGAPDLAVEVVSTGDTASEVQEKVREYLTAGTCLVWVADPQTRTVTAYRPNGDAHVYSENDVVSGENVLPGFSFRPVDLFRPS